MMVPASGGIGAFHLAMKLGISALFLSMGKDAKLGGEVGIKLCFYFSYHTIGDYACDGTYFYSYATKSKEMKR